MALLSCLLGCADVGLSACGGQWKVPQAAKEVKNPISPNASSLAEARQIYSARCAHCHGENGDGKRPPGTVYLYFVQPTNFTDAKIMDNMTDGEIFWKITTGNRPMPSYKSSLTDNERWKLVNLLRTFSHPPANPALGDSRPSR